MIPTAIWVNSFGDLKTRSKFHSWLHYGKENNIFVAGNEGRQSVAENTHDGSKMLLQIGTRASSIARRA